MKRLGLIFLFFFLLSLCFEAGALEEKQENLSVSVEVASTFGLSLDKPQLALGHIRPGKTIILGQGSFYNQVRCRSNYGRTWFLKAHLLSGLKLAGREYYLAASALKWKVAEAFSEAKPTEQFQFQEFSSQPSLIYISQGADNCGKEVILRFQYSLSCPGDAPAGIYTGQIVFTMSEAP